MLNVIAFEPQQSGRTRLIRRSGECEILLFTGVRYMRDHDGAGAEEPHEADIDDLPDPDDLPTERLKA